MLVDSMGDKKSENTKARKKKKKSKYWIRKQTKMKMKRNWYYTMKIERKPYENKTQYSEQQKINHFNFLIACTSVTLEHKLREESRLSDPI